MITMYGISNCDNIKKARKWLDMHQITYQFHHYKKDGIQAAELAQWVDQVGWEVLLNKRGTTWRKLPEAQKVDLDDDKANALMCEHSSMIKRPVLLYDEHIEVGFSDQRYAELFT